MGTWEHGKRTRRAFGSMLLAVLSVLGVSSAALAQPSATRPAHYSSWCGHDYKNDWVWTPGGTIWWRVYFDFGYWRALPGIGGYVHDHYTSHVIMPFVSNPISGYVSGCSS
jgi:hypothetical protein